MLGHHFKGLSANLYSGYVCSQHTDEYQVLFGKSHYDDVITSLNFSKLLEILLYVKHEESARLRVASNDKFLGLNYGAGHLGELQRLNKLELACPSEILIDVYLVQLIYED